MFAVLLLQLALAPPPAQALVAPTPAPSLLDVPFMAQTPELCGGAAVSMVLRYWGQRDVFPQDFAPLVSPSDGGIFTGVLAKAVSDRGWHALVDPASAGTGRARFRAEIDRGRPIVALIQVAPRTYHYVVVVGSTETDVIFHDPARAPFRVMDWSAFDLAWSAANRWMMVALPPAGFKPSAPEPSVAATPTGDNHPIATPCTALIAHAVQTAIAGNAGDAEQELTAAMRLCPADAAAWREMAGLRFSQKRWSDANQLATTATEMAPGDPYGWELAATSRYLMGDTTGSLAAWNRIGEPRVDAINIHGAERTPLPVVVRAAGLAPRTLLTPGSFSHARRRLRDLPVLSAAEMKFEPAAGGVANVNIAVVERPARPQGRAGLFALAGRPLTQRELRVESAGLFGAGDSAFAAWRFAKKRPRVTVGLAFPSPSRLPGITTFSGMWEQQSYAGPFAVDGSPLRETRRRAGLQLSDWASGWLKWQAGAAMDSFNGAGHFSADAALIARSRGDRAAVIVSAAQWVPVSDGRRFSTGGARLSARTTADSAQPVASFAMEFQRTSADAPLALWPGAGTGGGRTPYLRAHQLLDHGVVSGAVLGRELINATVEIAKPVRTIKTITLSLAAFADLARASRRQAGLEATPVYVDAGVGLRLRLPGGAGGLRLDVAHPLGDGRTIFSVGWIATWPR